jgi:hypothetical protein
MWDTVGWIVVMFFALSWSFGMTKSYYATPINVRIVIWWWLAIATIFFTEISVFHLFYLMPLAAILSLIGISIPGLFLTIFYSLVLFGVAYYFNS